ncbi:hypothetical protein BH09ACT6_BH09ACT6_00990 [soil metagenome]
MNLNRKNVALGLLALGLAGVLATGGAFAAQAATVGGTMPFPQSTGMPSSSGDLPGSMSGMMPDRDSSLVAAAAYLGLSQADLKAQMQSGTSLSDIAAAQGKSVSGLEDVLVAAFKTNLDSNGSLSDAQKATALERMKNRIASMVEGAQTPGEGKGMRMSDAMDWAGETGSDSGSGSTR